MTTLIRNCRLIDGVSKVPFENTWVMIRDGFIASIGINDIDSMPLADIIIDAKNQTLMPGMFNLHTHIQRRHLSVKGKGRVFREGAAYVENQSDAKRMLWAVMNAWQELRNGVTTIRDCASRNRINIELRDSIKEGIINGPRILACGFGIAATGGHETHRYQGAIEVDGQDEIRKAVRKEIKAGADFIKFMGSGGLGGLPEKEDPRWVELGIDELEAGIREAHNRQKRTTVHAMGDQAVLNALLAGIDCIEHGTVLSKEALDIMAERGVYYVPTASGITAVAEREAESGNFQLSELIESIVINPQRESIRRAIERGIKIGCGTDTLGDVVKELMILNSCGLPNMECIQTATSHAAEICGIEKITGTIEVGKIADLLLLRGNPFEDLETLRNVEMVFKGGEKVDFGWMIKAANQ